MNIKDVNSKKKLTEFLNAGGNINEIIKSGQYDHEENLLIYLLRTNKANYTLVKAIIENGININYVNSDNENALFHIQNDNKLKISKLIISKGIDVNCLNYKRENALLIKEIPAYIHEYYVINNMNIHQVDRMGKTYFEKNKDPGNVFDEINVHKKMNLALDHFNLDLPMEAVSMFLSTIDAGENEYAYECLKKFGERNFDFVKAKNQFIHFYEFENNVQSMMKEKESKLLNRVNLLFREIYKKIETRNDSDALAFKEDFMNIYIPDIVSDIQKDLLNDNLKSSKEIVIKKQNRI